MPNRRERRARARQEAAARDEPPARVVWNIPAELNNLDLSGIPAELPGELVHGVPRVLDEPSILEDRDVVRILTTLNWVPFGPQIDVPGLVWDLLRGDPGSMGLTDSQLEYLTTYLNKVGERDQVRGMVFMDNLNTLNDGRWLDNFVIDEYLKLLCSYSTNYLNAPAFLISSSRLERMLAKSDSECHFVYSEGRREAIQFRQSNRFLFPVCLLNNHWALIALDLRTGKLHGYDSLAHTGRYTEPLRDAMDCFKDFVTFNIYKLTGSQCNPSTFTTLVSAPCPSQGSNTTDCGVHVCMLAKFLILNENLSFTQRDMSAARQILKYEIITGDLLTS